MNLMHWRSRPASPLFNLQQEINRMFEDFGHVGPRDNGESAISPALDIKEDDQSLTVTADLPGVDGKDVEIAIDGDVLSIKGEKRSERHEKKDTYRCVERMFGSFERRVTLPTEVDSERAEASMSNGVLTLHLPKMEGKRAKTIPIKASGGSSGEPSMMGSSSKSESKPEESKPGGQSSQQQASGKK